MKLLVKTLTGGKFDVQAEESNTVAEVKAIIEMPGAVVLIIVRHPFTRSRFVQAAKLFLVLWQQTVFHRHSFKLVCAIIPFRLVSAFRDKLERQTPGNGYLER